jgi:negative regulator of flagellin synthesis FlgM
MAALGGINSSAGGFGSPTPSGGVTGSFSLAENGLSPAASPPAKSGTSAVALASIASQQAVDQTRLSPTANTTASAVAQALLTPEVRSEKIAALQTAIANGTYQVPAGEVAGKMVDSLLQDTERV